MEAQPLQHRRRVLEVVTGSRDSYFWTIELAPNGAPAFRGRWDTDYACGSCGARLCEGVRDGMLSHLMFACPCGAVNRVPAQ
jgi:hypothetical protein